MQISSAQLIADRDRQFADWGESITFREVTQVYVPGTQQLVETFVDTALTAIAGAGGSKPSAGTAGLHLSDETSFLVRAEDLPTSSPTPTSRVVYGGVEFDVIAFSLSAHSLVYVLSCRKKS